MTDTVTRTITNTPSLITHQWSTGRCPWYHPSTTATIKPLLIGVAGASASGKTTVCTTIVDRLNIKNVICISMDSFYKHNDAAALANAADINFDHPRQFDWPLFIQCIHDMAENKAVDVPEYSFVTHTRTDTVTNIYGADVILIDGLFTLYDPAIRSMLDLSIFVDTEADVCLARRIKRDIAERGRTIDGVLTQYFATVKPGFDNFIAPSRRYADLIVPHGGDTINETAITLLVQHIQGRLLEREIRAHAHSTQTSRRNSHMDAAPADIRNGKHGDRLTVVSSIELQQWLTASNPTYPRIQLTHTTKQHNNTISASPQHKPIAMQYDGSVSTQQMADQSVRLTHTSLPSNIDKADGVYIVSTTSELSDSEVSMAVQVCHISAGAHV